MQTRALGRTGLAVSHLGLGTMTWGRQTPAEDAVAQLEMFRDAGGTLIDSAASYGDGAAEEILGAALAARSDRHEIVLATKAGISRRTGEPVVDASRRTLLDALDGSLRRLQTDHVDLWQVHAWDVSVPLEETLAALETAVSSGRTRYIGVSNYRGWQLGTAASWQRAWPGRTPLAGIQSEYSLLRRNVERDVLAAAGHHGLGLLAWSPLAGGVLTGKYRRGVPDDARGADPYWTARVAAYRDDRSERIVDAVVTAADGLGVSPLAVALAWVRDRVGVSAALVGARTVAQLSAQLVADSVRLPAEISEALDDVSA
jgi:aryl-alcohol dehydrogenase-like predicted oxidoreductase